MENTRFRIETTGFNILIPAEELPASGSAYIHPDLPAGLGIEDIVGKIIYIEGKLYGSSPIKAVTTLTSVVDHSDAGLIEAWTSVKVTNSVSYDLKFGYMPSGRGCTITATMVR